MAADLVSSASLTAARRLRSSLAANTDMTGSNTLVEMMKSMASKPLSASVVGEPVTASFDRAGANQRRLGPDAGERGRPRRSRQG